MRSSERSGKFSNSNSRSLETHFSVDFQVKLPRVWVDSMSVFSNHSSGTKRLKNTASIFKLDSAAVPSFSNIPTPSISAGIPGTSAVATGATPGLSSGMLDITGQIPPVHFRHKSLDETGNNVAIEAENTHFQPRIPQAHGSQGDMMHGRGMPAPVTMTRAAPAGSGSMMAKLHTKPPSGNSMTSPQRMHHSAGAGTNIQQQQQHPQERTNLATRTLPSTQMQPSQHSATPVSREEIENLLGEAHRRLDDTEEHMIRKVRELVANLREQINKAGEHVQEQLDDVSFLDTTLEQNIRSAVKDLRVKATQLGLQVGDNANQ